MSRGRKKWIEMDGELHTISQWARMYGINSKTLFNRLTRGWDLKTALTTPTFVSRPEEHPKNAITVEDKKRCMNCYHTYGTLYGGDVGCQYILDTGHRRPCPAHNCKVFKPLKGRRPPEQMTVVPRREELWI